MKKKHVGPTGKTKMIPKDLLACKTFFANDAGVKRFWELDLKTQERIRDIVSQKLNNAFFDIQEATGYWVNGVWDILEDTIANSFEVDLNISLLTRPHGVDDEKVRHYIKHNPHNVLNEPIHAFKHGHWYDIYNGVHRVEAARRMGKKTIKAVKMLPDKEGLGKRNLI